MLRTHEDEAWARRIAEDAGTAPVHETVLVDAYDIGAAFVTWEWATALAGFLLGINPFDEPDVSAAKAATAKVLSGELEPVEVQTRVDGVGLGFEGRAIDTLRTRGARRGSSLRALCGRVGRLPRDPRLRAPEHRGVRRDRGLGRRGHAADGQAHLPRAGPALPALHRAASQGWPEHRRLRGGHDRRRGGRRGARQATGRCATSTTLSRAGMSRRWLSGIAEWLR